MNKRNLAPLHSAIDWNDGLLEYWNVGFGRLGKWKNGIDKKRHEVLLFHHSIIPVMV